MIQHVKCAAPGLAHYDGVSNSYQTLLWFFLINARHSTKPHVPDVQETLGMGPPFGMSRYSAFTSCSLLLSVPRNSVSFFFPVK